MIAAPALPPEEVLGMRADLALAILAGRSSLMTHPGTTAPGSWGTSGDTSKGSWGTSGGSGGRVVRITTMDELKQFLGR